MWLIRNSRFDSYIWDIWLLPQDGPNTTFALNVSSKFFLSKINLNHITDIVFDLRNEFHANRMKFGILGAKNLLRQYLPILTPLPLKIVNLGQNKSFRAEKLTTILFLYGESEKTGPGTICRPTRFQVLRILLTFSLKYFWNFKALNSNFI